MTYGRAIVISRPGRVQVPRIVPAISAKQITARCIRSYYAAIELGKSKAIVASLITFDHDLLYLTRSLNGIERHREVHGFALNTSRM